MTKPTFHELLEGWKRTVEHAEGKVDGCSCNEGSVVNAARIIEHEQSEGIPFVQALFEHIMIAEHYYHVLQQSAYLIAKTNEERNQVDEQMEAFWHAAMDMAKHLDALQAVDPDRGVAVVTFEELLDALGGRLVQVFEEEAAAEKPEESSPMRYDPLRVVKGGKA